jgi:hypothetical protein
MSAAAAPTAEQRVELPPHPVVDKAAEYIAGMTVQQKELHELATQMLGSSYFVERTHGFRKWLATKAGPEGTSKAK